MADFNNAVMTNGGAALLAATTAGTAKIKFTKLVTGSGTYSDSEKTRASLQARSTLKAQKQEIPFHIHPKGSWTLHKRLLPRRRINRVNVGTAINI